MDFIAIIRIAERLPITIEELNELGVLDENVVKVYGEQLLEHVRVFIFECRALIASINSS